MKTVITILAFTFLLSSCEKKEVKPEPVTPTENQRYFNWNTVGYKGITEKTPFPDQYGNVRYFDCTRIDTCQVFVNGVLTYTSTYGYHRIFKKGDKISFRLKGNRDSAQAECKFEIWEDKNQLPQPKAYRCDSYSVIKGEYIVE